MGFDEISGERGVPFQVSPQVSAPFHLSKKWEGGFGPKA
jgi:hypothetical protein